MRAVVYHGARDVRIEEVAEPEGALRPDEVLLARNDYGAVRGFFLPRGADPSLGAGNSLWARYEDGGPAPPPGGHRWTRHRAWIRMVPTVAASASEWVASSSGFSSAPGR